MAALRQVTDTTTSAAPQLHTAQPDKYEVRATIAQEDMAFWAEAMFWVTLASLAIAVCALLGLKAQISQNRRSSERQLRAYLAVKPLGVVKLIGSENMLGQVLLKNVGSTLATNVALEVNAAIEPGRRERTDFPVGGDPKHMPRGLQPGDEMAQGSKNSLQLADVQATGDFIFIWGVAHYDDGFGQRRFTRFCHRYSCASYDRAAFRKASDKGVRESLTIIASDKARLNEIGNDAD